MKPEDPVVAQLLAELAPIAEPPPPAAWPPGPGWWVLLALAVLALATLAAWLWLRHRRRAYRRYAQAELAALADGAPAHTVLELLKRTARAACPAESRAIGGLYGRGFGQLLQAALPQPERGAVLVRAAQVAYGPEARLDEELRRGAADWIAQHCPKRLRRALAGATHV